KKGDAEYREVEADTKLIENRLLENDPLCHHYTAVMRDLEPDTTYVYRVGHPDKPIWSEESEFTTAPDKPKPFTFVTFGDTHNRDIWGEMVKVIEDRHPDISFFTIAGDLVDTGQYRDDWDRFFHCAGHLGTRIPLVPTIGNHEVIDGMGVEMYVDQFALPENGPKTVQCERAFSIEYSNLKFVSLDSTLPVLDQADWLEEQVEDSDADWKFTMFHFPPYNYEDPYPEIRNLWGYIFDKHHVDISLEGHTHYYMRSHPMFRDRPRDKPEQGTIHVISIPIENRPREIPPNNYAAVQFSGIPVYQYFEIDGKNLSYKVYDIDGNVLDEFDIVK
ncbi:MAG: metallophosphoesterase family protein, partial [Candidatus Omnitrophica bacterium]|nr:metallophosphoesterase family protein [Candidatus Omnitrophota bacterium]